MSADESLAENRRMFEDRAELYDLIYSGKKYGDEAEVVRNVLAEHGIADGAAVLEAACGTGSYLVYLKQWYRVAGFDISAALVEIARRKLGEAVPLFTADMRSFTVPEPFDAIVCLFSSIGYLPDEAAVAEAARSYFGALKPGGVLLIEPWIEPHEWSDGRAFSQTAHDDESGVNVCRAGVSRSEGNRSILDFHWLVADPDRGVEYFSERHLLTMLSRETLRDILGSTGFECHLLTYGLHDQGNRRLIVCRKP